MKVLVCAAVLLMASSDGVIELPFGAGAAYRYRGLLLEARAGYRGALDEDLIPGITRDTTGLDTWDVGVAIGWEL